MRDLLRILIAPLLWFVSFSAIYGLHGTLCAHPPDGTLLGLPSTRVLLIVAYVIAVLLQLALLFALYHPRFRATSPFASFTSRATGWVGLVATIWSLFPAVVTTYCG